jgi:hypothetical protein
MYMKKNLQNFYATKQASFMDYLKSMGIGAAIGGGAGAGLGVYGGSKWDDEFKDGPLVPELGNDAQYGPGGSSPQEVMEGILADPRFASEVGMGGAAIPENPQFTEEEVAEAIALLQSANNNPKTTGGIAGGLGGAALGAGGGLAYQGIKDLLFSGDKEAQVKRAALGEEDLLALRSLLEEVDQEKRKNRESGPKYGQRFLRGALGGGLMGAPYGALMGGMIGDQSNQLPEGIGFGGLAGLVGGAGLGGLTNMLGGYMNEDMYDRIAEV